MRNMSRHVYTTCISAQESTCDTRVSLSHRLGREQERPAAAAASARVHLQVVWRCRWGRKEQKLLTTFIITYIRFNCSSMWRGRHRSNKSRYTLTFYPTTKSSWPIINRVGWAKGGKMVCLTAPRRSSLVLENGERLTRLFISRCLQPPASLSAHFLPRFTFNKLSLTCRVLGRPRQSDGRLPSTTCSGRHVTVT